MDTLGSVIMSCKWGFKLKYLYVIIGTFLLIGMCQGCSKVVITENNLALERDITIELKSNNLTTKQLDPINLAYFENINPLEWGENVTGVKTQILTNEKKFALTFDACGGDYGSAYD